MHTGSRLQCQGLVGYLNRRELLLILSATPVFSDCKSIFILLLQLHTLNLAHKNVFIKKSKYLKKKKFRKFDVSVKTKCVKVSATTNPTFYFILPFIFIAYILLVFTFKSMSKDSFKSPQWHEISIEHTVPWLQSHNGTDWKWKICGKAVHLSVMTYRLWFLVNKWVKEWTRNNIWNLQVMSSYFMLLLSAAVQTRTP